MKTATMPALRVLPELREAAERALLPGETLSGFVEESVRLNVERRQAQKLFIARGLSARDAARKSGQYVAAEAVLEKLAAQLKPASKARTATASRRSRTK